LAGFWTTTPAVAAPFPLGMECNVGSGFSDSYGSLSLWIPLAEEGLHQGFFFAMPVTLTHKIKPFFFGILVRSFSITAVLLSLHFIGLPLALVDRSTVISFVSAHILDCGKACSGLVAYYQYQDYDADYFLAETIQEALVSSRKPMNILNTQPRTRVFWVEWCHFPCDLIRM